MLRQHTSREDADAQSQIPSGEIGGCSGAALGVGGKIDEQGIERRERHAEAQAAT